MSKRKWLVNFSWSNKHCIRRLEYMSSLGWHFKRWFWIIILCEKGLPTQYKYELLYEKKFDEEREKFYQAAGWTVVRNGFLWQIVRGNPDAPPVFTDVDSKLMMWRYRICFTVMVAMICLLLRFFMIFMKSSNMVNFISGFTQGMFLGFVILIVYFIYRYNKAKKDEY
ncbi:DUF2812 domain-containing protein [Gemella bergeri]